MTSDSESGSDLVLSGERGGTWNSLRRQRGGEESGGSGWRETPPGSARSPAGEPPLCPWVPLGAEGFWERSYFFPGRSLRVDMMRHFLPPRQGTWAATVSLGHLASREGARRLGRRVSGLHPLWEGHRWPTASGDLR